MRFLVASNLLLCAALAGQSPTPIRFDCSEDDLRSLSCTTAEPCPVYLEIASLETVGARLFLAGNLHTETATLYSILLASDDRGATWTEPQSRIRSATLEQIQFIDFETGWIGGQVFGAVPRDPFFLLTTDGGKSWRRQPVFDESRPSTIEQFWFESRTSGSVAILRGATGETSAGRHELYETMTGGGSWTLRQVTEKPVAIRGARSALRQSGWRVSAHASTKTLRVERLDGDTWRPQAAFPIQIGVCKPPDEESPKP